MVGKAKKLNHRTRRLRGRIKRTAGQVTGDRALHAAGQAEQASTTLGRVVQKITGIFRGRSRRRRRHP